MVCPSDVVLIRRTHHSFSSQFSTKEMQKPGFSTEEVDPKKLLDYNDTALSFLVLVAYPDFTSNSYTLRPRMGEKSLRLTVKHMRADTKLADISRDCIDLFLKKIFFGDFRKIVSRCLQSLQKVAGTSLQTSLTCFWTLGRLWHPPA